MKTSLKYNIAIRLSTIRNITVRQKTCFQLRLTIFSKNEKNQNIIASPYQCFVLGSNSRTQNNTRAGQIMVDSYMSPKILVNGTGGQTPINSLCVFKGQLPISQKKNQNSEIIIFAELFLIASRQPEMIAEWTGSTETTCINSAMQIYFSNHFLSCAVGASIHCITTQFTTSYEDFFKDLQKSQGYYNYKQKQISSLYDASIDPLLDSLNSLVSWDKNMRKYEQISKQVPRRQDNGQWKYFRLKRLLQVSSPNKQDEKKKIDFKATQQQLKKKDYLECIKADAYRISEYIFICWKDFLSLIQRYPKNQYLENLTKQYWEQYERNNWRNYYKITDAKQNQIQTLYPNLLYSSQSKQVFLDQKHKCQIKFKMDDLKAICNQISKENQHVLILVHGFQASSFDMELIGSYFKYKNPDLNIMISQANQGKTESAIEECAHRLALEVKNYINTRGLKQANISFMGHSLGGLIIRASLKYLQLYKHNFCLYISLCTPHIGYLYHTSKLITTSMWVMNMVKKDQSMIELTMNDNQQITKTFLYELSERNQLDWFQKIVLFGSQQDQYVPFGSALLVGRQFFYQTNNAKIHQKMYQNITQSIQQKIMRFELVFKDKVTDLSGFIGRTAHIKALSHLPVIRLYSDIISKLF